MRIAPRGIAATGLPACYIDYIFNSKAQSIEHAAASRRSSNVVRKALLCATLIEEHFIPGTLDGRWAIRDFSSKNDGFQAVTPCAPISRRARSAPSDNHQDRETKGPCFSSQELPDRLHRLALLYLHRCSSNVRSLLAASPYLANGMTCDQSFQVTDFLRTTRS